jgi:hypothetical protein
VLDDVYSCKRYIKRSPDELARPACQTIVANESWVFERTYPTDVFPHAFQYDTSISPQPRLTSPFSSASTLPATRACYLPTTKAAYIGISSLLIEACEAVVAYAATRYLSLVSATTISTLMPPYTSRHSVADLDSTYGTARPSRAYSSCRRT